MSDFRYLSLLELFAVAITTGVVLWFLGAVGEVLATIALIALPLLVLWFTQAGVAVVQGRTLAGIRWIALVWISVFLFILLVQLPLRGIPFFSDSSPLRRAAMGLWLVETFNPVLPHQKLAYITKCQVAAVAASDEVLNEIDALLSTSPKSTPDFWKKWDEKRQKYNLVEREREKCGEDVTDLGVEPSASWPTRTGSWFTSLGYTGLIGLGILLIIGGYLKGAREVKIAGLILFLSGLFLLGGGFDWLKGRVGIKPPIVYARPLGGGKFELPAGVAAATVAATKGEWHAVYADVEVGKVLSASNGYREVTVFPPCSDDYVGSDGYIVLKSPEKTEVRIARGRCN